MDLYSAYWLYWNVAIMYVFVAACAAPMPDVYLLLRDCFYYPTL